VSDQPQPAHGSVLVNISERLIRVLPPAFVLLIILNIAFLAAFTWTFERNAETRNVLLTKIVERCLLDPHPRP
jgi:hypothetical protein